MNPLLTYRKERDIHLLTKGREGRIYLLTYTYKRDGRKGLTPALTEP